MLPKRLIILALACTLLLNFGCTPSSNAFTEREFSYSSGGAYHISGFGEWSITLDQAGNFAVTHIVNDMITDYGTFALSTEENAALWDLIDAADINKLKSSGRLGMPDEVQYTLALTENGRRHEVQIWIDEAQKIEAITQLVAKIGSLIETYTGQQPVLN